MSSLYLWVMGSPRLGFPRKVSGKSWVPVTNPCDGPPTKCQHDSAAILQWAIAFPKGDIAPYFAPCNRCLALAIRAVITWPMRDAITRCRPFSTKESINTLASVSIRSASRFNSLKTARFPIPTCWANGRRPERWLRLAEDQCFFF